jgi:hypothetical protein
MRGHNRVAIQESAADARLALSRPYGSKRPLESGAMARFAGREDVNQCVGPMVVNRKLVETSRCNQSMRGRATSAES